MHPLFPQEEKAVPAVMSSPTAASVAIGSPLAASVDASVVGGGSLASPQAAGAPFGNAAVMSERSYLDAMQARFEAGGGRESVTRLLYVATIAKGATKQQVRCVACVQRLV